MKIVKSYHNTKHFGDKGFIYGEVQDVEQLKDKAHTPISIKETLIKHKKYKITTLPELTSNKIILSHTWTHHNSVIDIDTITSTPDNKEFINWLNIIKTYQEIRKSLIYLPWTVRFSELGIEKVHKLLDNNFYIITNPRTMITENLSIQLSEFTWFARFRYNRALVEALKLHANNRQWHSDIKCWSFTALDQSKIDELCNKLSDSAGIFPSLLDTCQLQFSRNRVIWKAWTEF